jgi:hypothetical protein
VFNEAAELLPMGGAGVLLVYLLRVWLVERRGWLRERAEIQEQNRTERNDLILRHREREANDADTIKHLRDRVHRLEDRTDNLADRLRAAGEDVHE